MEFVKLGDGKGLGFCEHHFFPKFKFIGGKVNLFCPFEFDKTFIGGTSNKISQLSTLSFTEDERVRLLRDVIERL